MAFSFLKRLFGSEPQHAGQFAPMVNAPAETPDKAGSDGEPVQDLEQLQGFVRYVATSLVDAPEEVRLGLAEKGDLTIIQIHCRQPDIGKLIGKSGKTISALRTLVSGASARLGRRVSVDVMDD